MQSPFITLPIIHIKRARLQTFRDDARRCYPREHFAALWGTFHERGIFVEEIDAVDYAADGMGTHISSDDLRRSRREASEEGLEMIGSIHSHPSDTKDDIDTISVLSKLDHEDGWAQGELISGLVIVRRSKTGHLYTAVRWWLPQGKIKMRYS